jgi:hypothetical protein
MNRYVVNTIAALTLSASFLWAATPGISLVGKGLVDGSSLDMSGLTGSYRQASDSNNTVPKSILGGFGSAFTYTGHDDVFIAAPDRGPFDGLTDTPYIDRFHFFHLSLDVNEPFPNVEVEILDSRFLVSRSGKYFLGAASEYDSLDDSKSLRFDPEGIRVSPWGTFFISDEYGPYVNEFNRQGHLVRKFTLPKKFSIDKPSEDPNAELLANIAGRQANRGMEGLAISPDGKTLYGIMQNALIQDHGLKAGTTNRVGLNNRIVKIDVRTGKTQEFVYVVEAINRGQGVCEILAVNDHEFLVLERDNRSFLSAEPQAPSRKKIWKIDISGATDISSIDSLPAETLPEGVVPVTKTLFIDLLDADYGLDLNDSNAIAEKLEGLTWGEDFEDGNHLLYVTSDNDLNPNQPSQIFAFSIDKYLLNVKGQILPDHLYPHKHCNKFHHGGKMNKCER